MKQMTGGGSAALIVAAVLLGITVAAAFAQSKRRGHIREADYKVVKATAGQPFDDGGLKVKTTDFDQPFVLTQGEGLPVNLTPPALSGTTVNITMHFQMFETQALDDSGLYLDTVLVSGTNFQSTHQGQNLFTGDNSYVLTSGSTFALTFMTKSTTPAGHYTILGSGTADGSTYGMVFTFQVTAP
jgi:hypothetical protein